MDLNALFDTPPWEWPVDAGKLFLKALVDKHAKVSDRLMAAELAGDLVAINDDLAAALLAIAGSGDESAELRARAAIALGPVLELADTELIDDEFDDPEGVPISVETFRNIQESLHKLYLDNGVPAEVRRRTLEASVRAAADWHARAIKEAYSSADKDWVVTAVFSMGYVAGFDEQILEALESADPDIHYEAVRTVADRAIDAAWRHVVALVENPSTPKALLLAAIEAVGNIRPQEAADVLMGLADSDDQEIADAVDEALATGQSMSGEVDEGEDEEEDDGKWVN
jgi:hypothetical protein